MKNETFKVCTSKVRVTGCGVIRNGLMVFPVTGSKTLYSVKTLSCDSILFQSYDKTVASTWANSTSNRKEHQNWIKRHSLTPSTEGK